MPLYIGMDLGGTNIKAGIVDPITGEVSQEASIPTHSHEGHQAVMDRMAGLILQLIAVSGKKREDFGGLGVTAPGVLDLAEGRTLFLPNLPGNWPDVPLRAELQQQTGLPVALLNDARAITYGEWRFGAGRGVDSMALFAFGTGVGGGLVINGRLHLAMGGTSAELGHQSIDYNGPLCGCGGRGCLETYASGPAIAAMGVKAVIQGQTTLIRDLAENDLNRINAGLIAEAALQGDALALGIYDHVGFCIGMAAANICVGIGPERIVIGGGVARAFDLLIGPIQRTLRERVRVTRIDQVQVVRCLLGDNAGVIGGAMWAMENT